MSVVNVSIERLRRRDNIIAYINLKDWMNRVGNVYIGRAGAITIDGGPYPKYSSRFCNPFKINVDGSREEVLKKYENYMIELLKDNLVLLYELKALRGMNLGCWCHPEPCHGDVILKLIEEYFPIYHSPNL